LTREPSGSRASTIGELSSTRLPNRAHDAVDDAHQVAIVLKVSAGPQETQTPTPKKKKQLSSTPPRSTKDFLVGVARIR